MIKNNERHRQVRRYFIQVEKRQAPKALPNPITPNLRSRINKKAHALKEPTAIRVRFGGKFPEPLTLGRASGWLESEIQQWISGFVSAREDASCRSDAPFLAYGSHAKR